MLRLLKHMSAAFATISLSAFNSVLVSRAAPRCLAGHLEAGAAVTKRDLPPRSSFLFRPADSAWPVIALDRPRVERRAPNYGPCISEDGNGSRQFSVQPRNGQPLMMDWDDRAWLVVDDVDGSARPRRSVSWSCW